MFLDKWEAFDSSWLLSEAKRQFPEDYELHVAIENCKKVMSGCYFVDPSRPNRHGSDWQFERSITIEDTVRGDVVLDILKDGRIGSIEYLDEVLRRK